MCGDPPGGEGAAAREPLPECMWCTACQVVKELLRVGPSLNAIDADGNGALHLAAQDGHAAIVTLLKERGVVDGLPNLQGQCPADLARAAGHAAIARALAEGAVRKVRCDYPPRPLCSCPSV